jgi:hypothetical protein
MPFHGAAAESGPIYGFDGDAAATGINPQVPDSQPVT